MDDQFHAIGTGQAKGMSRFCQHRQCAVAGSGYHIIFQDKGNAVAKDFGCECFVFYSCNVDHFTVCDGNHFVICDGGCFQYFGSCFRDSRRFVLISALIGDFRTKDESNKSSNDDGDSNCYSGSHYGLLEDGQGQYGGVTHDKYTGA